MARPLPHALATLTIAVAVFGACSDDGESGEFETLVDFVASEPGVVIGLIANDDERTVEYLDRLAGTINSVSVDDTGGEPELLATIPVGTDGEQRGLLGQVVIDGRRFAAWTRPETFELVVGEIVDGAPGPIVFSAGESSSGANGGVLRELDGEILLGLGRNTGFDRETGIGGTMLAIDPDATPDDRPRIISQGYTNPWAFTVVDGTDIWVADNAAGPDPENDAVDDIERIGRADLVADRANMERITEPGRAPTSMVELPDGRIGICGFLDNELRAYEVVRNVESDADDVLPTLDRAGTIMPCLTGATVFADGTIVTVALGDPGTGLDVRRP